jgi:hypothetical protein
VRKLDVDLDVIGNRSHKYLPLRIPLTIEEAAVCADKADALTVDAPILARPCQQVVATGESYGSTSERSGTTVSSTNGLSHSGNSMD